MPHFLDEPERKGKTNTFADLMRYFIEGIDALDPRVKRGLSFGEFCHLKEKHISGARSSCRGG